MQIEIDDQDIDVKEIMQRVKSTLGKYNMNEDITNLKVNVENAVVDSNLLEQLMSQLTKLNRSWNISVEYSISSHRKGIGNFIVLGKKIVRKLLRWYIKPIMNDQAEYNANVTRSMNATWGIIQQQNELNSRLTQNMQTLTDEVAKLNAQNAQLSIDYHDLLKQVNLVQYNATENLENTNDNIRNIKDKLYNITDNVQDLLETRDETSRILHAQDLKLIGLEQDNTRELNISLSDQFTKLHNNIRISNERMRRIERNLRSKQINIEEYSSLKPVVKNEDLDFDYFLFEEYYRGSREEIMARQKQYLPYFSNSKNVLDLGCGRGEFTELLLEQGVLVTSVDLNDDMVAFCSERGYNIIQADAIEYMKSLEDHSVDGIFLGQVIEHLTSADLISLVKLAYSKLTPNSWLIAETPNPRSLSIFAQSFYMDLTHTKPVHPFTAQFIWESTGFHNIEVQYFSPNNPVLKIPELNITEINDDTMRQFNTALSHWNEILFGNQDYFIAGKK